MGKIRIKEIKQHYVKFTLLHFFKTLLGKSAAAMAAAATAFPSPLAVAPSPPLAPPLVEMGGHVHSSHGTKREI